MYAHTRTRTHNVAAVFNAGAGAHYQLWTFRTRASLLFTFTTCYMKISGPLAVET